MGYRYRRPRRLRRRRCPSPLPPPQPPSPPSRGAAAAAGMRAGGLPRGDVVSGRRLLHRWSSDAAAAAAALQSDGSPWHIREAGVSPEDNLAGMAYCTPSREIYLIQQHSRNFRQKNTSSSTGWLYNQTKKNGRPSGDYRWNTGAGGAIPAASPAGLFAHTRYFRWSLADVPATGQV